MNKKKLLSASLVGVMGMMALTGCGDSKDSGNGNGGGGAVSKDADATKGTVRFLNFKPEIADAWQTVIDDFTAETGIKDCSFRYIRTNIKGRYYKERCSNIIHY